MRSVDVLQISQLAKRLPWRGFRLLRVSLPLATVVMEFCWIYPWVLMLTGLAYGRFPIPLLPAWPTFGLLLLGDLTVRAAHRTLPLAKARLIVVSTGLCMGLLVVRHTYYPAWALWQLGWVGDLARAAHDALPTVAPPVMGALAAAALWWRGVVLGERDSTHEDSEQAFQRGVAWSVVFVLLMALYGDTSAFALTASAVSYLLGFLALGLIAMAVARLVEIWEESHADDQQALAMNRHWLALLVILVGIMLLAATLLSRAVGVDIWSHLSPLLEPLLPVVEVIFAIVFAIAAVFARAILFVLSHIRAVQPRAGAPLGENPFGDFLRRLQELAVPPEVTGGARWGMVLLGVLVLCALIALAVVRRRRSVRPGVDDERESVWSVRAALGGLGDAWRSLWQRRHHAASEREDPHVAAIRMLYRHLLHLAAAGGVPRTPWQTPYEYLPRLRLWVPERESECEIVTEAYVRVRYTPHPPAPEEIAQVRAAVDSIQRHVELPQS